MIQKPTKILCLTGLILILIGGLASGVSAQSANDTVIVLNESEVAQPEEYEFIVSDSARVLSTEWEGKTYIIRAESDKTSQITLSDAGRTARNGENVQYKVETYTVAREGVTEIRFTVEEDRQVAHSMDGKHWINGYDDSVRGWISGDYSKSALGLGIVWTFYMILANWVWLRVIVKNQIKRLD